MSELRLILEAFHFIRPVVLLLVPLVVALWWWVRATRTRRDVPGEGIAPHLRAALTVGAHGGGRVTAIDTVAAMLLLVVVGAAGPTWSRMPDPFVAQSAPMVVVLKVAPSMEEADVAPSRLERAKQKIRDLLDLRAGARTALVAYAGTAHVVVPMTEDPGVMVPYLEGLTPEVMQVVNESHMHNVPPDSETHFKLTLVSSHFEGLRQVQRHQLVYSLLQPLIGSPVHALALHTYTSNEWAVTQGAPASPPCLGGELP